MSLWVLGSGPYHDAYASSCAFPFCAFYGGGMRRRMSSYLYCLLMTLWPLSSRRMRSRLLNRFGSFVGLLFPY